MVSIDVSNTGRKEEINIRSLSSAQLSSVLFEMSHDNKQVFRCFHKLAKPEKSH